MGQPAKWVVSINSLGPLGWVRRHSRIRRGFSQSDSEPEGEVAPSATITPFTPRTRTWPANRVVRDQEPSVPSVCACKPSTFLRAEASDLIEAGPNLSKIPMRSGELGHGDSFPRAIRLNSLRSPFQDVHEEDRAELALARVNSSIIS